MSLRERKLALQFLRRAPSGSSVVTIACVKVGALRSIHVQPSQELLAAMGKYKEKLRFMIIVKASNDSKAGRWALPKPDA